jgi:hypothetical protein
MRTTLPMLLLGSLFLGTGCTEKSPVGPAHLDERFTLAPGEAAAVRGTSLRVTFLQVTGDSRCPADAFCIQGGDAIVHVRARDGGTAAYELHTGNQTRSAAVHDGFRITLEQLAPYPFSSRTIAPEEYRATLTVSRR